MAFEEDLGHVAEGGLFRSFGWRDADLDIGQAGNLAAIDADEMRVFPAACSSPLRVRTARHGRRHRAEPAVRRRPVRPGSDRASICRTPAAPARPPRRHGSPAGHSPPHAAAPPPATSCFASPPRRASRACSTEIGGDACFMGPLPYDTSRTKGWQPRFSMAHFVAS